MAGLIPPAICIGTDDPINQTNSLFDSIIVKCIHRSYKTDKNILKQYVKKLEKGNITKKNNDPYLYILYIYHKHIYSKNYQNVTIESQIFLYHLYKDILHMYGDLIEEISKLFKSEKLSDKNKKCFIEHYIRYIILEKIQCDTLFYNIRMESFWENIKIIRSWLLTYLKDKKFNKLFDIIDGYNNTIWKFNKCLFGKDEERLDIDINTGKLEDFAYCVQINMDMNTEHLYNLENPRICKIADIKRGVITRPYRINIFMGNTMRIKFNSYWYSTLQLSLPPITVGKNDNNVITYVRTYVSKSITIEILINDDYQLVGEFKLVLQKNVDESQSQNNWNIVFEPIYKKRDFLFTQALMDINPIFVQLVDDKLIDTMYKIGGCTDSSQSIEYIYDILIKNHMEPLMKLLS